MRVSTGLLIGTILVLVCASFVWAQAPVDPSGHWEGVVQIPDRPMAIVVDLTASATGALAGTFGQPSQGVKALPLTSVSLDGRTIRFVVKGNDQGSTFTGKLADDGKGITGEVTSGEYVIPFTLTHGGAAGVVKAPVSPAISKELEGTWSGSMIVDGSPMPLEVQLTNQADGTSRGVIASPAGGGIKVPITIVQAGKNVTFDIDAVGASFSGELNADATEVKGTWTQNNASLALTLTRAQR
jgi:hypothetical protein